MNFKRRWKPGGRERQRSATAKWLDNRKKDLSGGERQRSIEQPPLIPRRPRREV